MNLPASPHAGDSISDVLPDLIGGLEPEKVEVAQQIVMERQELQVELGQRQATLACAASQSVLKSQQRASNRERRRYIGSRGRSRLSPWQGLACSVTARICGSAGVKMAVRLGQLPMQ